eukprot:1964-Heterococcus_DN1.PRE.3
MLRQRLYHVACAAGRPCQLLQRAAATADVGSSSSSRQPSRRHMAIKSKIKHTVEKPSVSVVTGLMMVQKNARERKRRFVESVEIALQLGVDPRKTNQIVRGMVVLPYGTGKEVRVAVFARGAEAEAARAAGASRVGAEDLLEDIQAGKLDFDRLIATPDMMPLIGRVARILGPRGLMPNPKLGTITKDTAPAVKAARAGQVQYRAMKDGMVMAPLGKVTFPHAHLMENLRAFMIAISSSKPEAAKGRYMKQAHLSSTMGKGINLNVATIDPANGRFMLITEAEKALLAQHEADAVEAAAADAQYEAELDQSEVAFIAARAALAAEREALLAAEEAAQHSEQYSKAADVLKESASTEQQQLGSAPAA